MTVRSSTLYSNSLPISIKYIEASFEIEDFRSLVENCTLRKFLERIKKIFVRWFYFISFLLPLFLSRYIINFCTSRLSNNSFEIFFRIDRWELNFTPFKLQYCILCKLISIIKKIDNEYVDKLWIYWEIQRIPQIR